MIVAIFGMVAASNFDPSPPLAARRRAFLAVELDRLLLVESIDIRIAAIRLGAAPATKASIRVAALPRAVLPTWMMFSNFLLRLPPRKAVRSSGRSLARMPTA